VEGLLNWQAVEVNLADGKARCKETEGQKEKKKIYGKKERKRKKE
jgi:hypothetical protein